MKKKKICLVDDTHELRDGVAELLEMEGYDVRAFRTPVEALEDLVNVVPDLVITDLWMPVMDGLVFIARLKEKPDLEKIPVLIFSARPAADYELQAKSLGVTRFIKKPATLEEILDAVESVFSDHHEK